VLFPSSRGGECGYSTSLVLQQNITYLPRLSLGKLMKRMLGSHVLSLQLARVCIGN